MSTSPQYYETRQGDTLDQICYSYYGSVYGGQVEAVLEANRALNLGKYSPVLPIGLKILLPVVSAKTQQVARLFS